MKILTAIALSVGILFVAPCFAELDETVTQKMGIIYVPPIKVAVVQPELPIAVYVAKPSQADFEKLQKAIANTNALRAEKGLPPLRYDENLSAYAQFRASEIEQKFSHERPNGQYYKVGMNMGLAVGENIAAGKQTADETIIQFRDSPKHYATILHDKFTKIGMGVMHFPNSKYKYYWVQIFGADNTKSAYAFDGDNQTLTDSVSTGGLIANASVNGSFENDTSANKLQAGQVESKTANLPTANMQATNQTDNVPPQQNTATLHANHSK